MRPVTEPERHVARRAGEIGQERQIEAARNHDAHRLTTRPHVTHRELRIIGARRARPHHHRIVARAQAVDHAPRLWSGDPLAMAGGRGDAAIKA